MSDYLLNGYIYHETDSDEARAAIERAGDANLATTVDGLPAWVFDGVCVVKGEPVPGHVPIDWHAAGDMCASEQDDCSSGMGDNPEDYYYDH